MKAKFAIDLPAAPGLISAHDFHRIALPAKHYYRHSSFGGLAHDCSTQPALEAGFFFLSPGF